MYKHPKTPYGVVIGRFQIFHNSHKNLVTEALQNTKKVCIVLGSAKASPDPKNPFPPKFREEMIRSCFSVEENEKLTFVYVRDYKYNLTQWLTDVHNKVLSSLECSDHEISLYGFFKDQSSFYLRCFPQWYLEEVSPQKMLDATSLRKAYFAPDAFSGEYGYMSDWQTHASKEVPEKILPFLEQFATTQIYKDLVKEYEYYQEYKMATTFQGTDRIKAQSWKPQFVTADAVIIQSAHILLVKRGVNPGKGLWALPGGFVEPSETLENAAVRELYEETGLIFQKPILKSCIKEGRIFDDPDRSLRGRTFTYAIFAVLPDNLQKGLPSIKAGDDASGAHWIPISDLGEMQNEFFEDHLDIINYFIRKI